MTVDKNGETEGQQVTKHKHSPVVLFSFNSSGQPSFHLQGRHNSARLLLSSNPTPSRRKVSIFSSTVAQKTI